MLNPNNSIYTMKSPNLIMPKDQTINADRNDEVGEQEKEGEGKRKKKGGQVQVLKVRPKKKVSRSWTVLRGLNAAGQGTREWLLSNLPGWVLRKVSRKG